MFTGIVEEAGRLESRVGESGGGAHITVRADKVVTGTHLGDSIAVNGACLTVTSVVGRLLGFDLLPATLAGTTLGMLHIGSLVNLERAMPADGRFGGHYVAGHVHGLGEVISITDAPDAAWRRLRVRVPSHLTRYTPEKGSITVDGVSLTIATAGSPTAPWVEVELVGTTLAVTTLGGLHPRMPVNVEVDAFGLYVERLLAAQTAERAAGVVA